MTDQPSDKLLGPDEEAPGDRSAHQAKDHALDDEGEANPKGGGSDEFHDLDFPAAGDDDEADSGGDDGEGGDGEEGDDAKAEAMLKQALALNPNGIDPNYFYGDFLLRQKRYKEAKVFLEKTLTAADRPGRAVADEGRRAETRALLKVVQEKL